MTLEDELLNQINVKIFIYSETEFKNFVSMYCSDCLGGDYTPYDNIQYGYSPENSKHYALGRFLLPENNYRVKVECEGFKSKNKMYTINQDQEIYFDASEINIPIEE
ncbi:hypothetical protein KY334_01565 [Candidatus Woesearchaeota archaeon]|nr:hypothetical protein [Candidatus Woesearchaeota archaeon]